MGALTYEAFWIFKKDGEKGILLAIMVSICAIVGALAYMKSDKVEMKVMREKLELHYRLFLGAYMVCLGANMFGVPGLTNPLTIRIFVIHNLKNGVTVFFYVFLLAIAVLHSLGFILHKVQSSKKKSVEYTDNLLSNSVNINETHDD